MASLMTNDDLLMTSLISYDLSKWKKEKPTVKWRSIFQGALTCARPLIDLLLTSVDL